MANRKDWLKLARETVLAVEPRDVGDLYTVEWSEAREVLVESHRDHIAAARPGIRRSVRTASAILYGLASRLSPTRRLVVFVVFLSWLFALVKLSGDVTTSDAAGAAVILLICGGLLLLLLAMELVDKLRFRDELVMARELQADLVPETLPDVPGWDMAAFNRVANTVGGDIYEVTPLPDGRVSLLFGDASGHGMAAGLVMAVAHTAYRLQVESDASPDAVTQALNRVLCRTGACRPRGARSFFAGVTLLLEPDGSFTACVAGHPPVLKVDRAGTIVAKIGQGSYPLGVKEGQTYSVETGRLEEGELLLLHSDGLPEARDAEGREYGDARISRVLSRMAGRPAAQLVDDLQLELFAFLGRVPPEDDVSITAVRRVPLPSA